VKDLIDGLDAEHDYMKAFGRQVPPDRAEETRRQYPPVRHPVAPRHPVSGRRYLYVNPFFTSHIDGTPAGLSASEAESLLSMLLAQSSIVEYQCRFSWTPHSVAFWDNHSVQHYAASDYWPEVRVMERASIVGFRPSR
jgi:alpha-ketoglutarate-dependent taurine dioxygenase